MFCPQFRPVVGGAERQAEKLSAALVQKGCRVSVLTPRLDSASPEFELQEGVLIHRFKLYDLSKAAGVRGLGPLNLLLLRYQTKKAVQRFAAGHDVLHANIVSNLSAFAVEAAHAAGLPTLCKIAMGGARNDFTELYRLGLGADLIARSIRRNLDGYIATTSAMRGDLLASGVPEEAIRLIPNGVDLPKIERWTRKGSRFLYLGRLSTTADRDVLSLLAAFDRLADRRADVELAVVGGGDLFDATALLVRDLKHANRVVLPGTQPAAKWLRWADFFVLPSRREGLSNALLEAMSYGLPCIANDIPPNREVLDEGRCGILVPVGDVNSMVSSMTSLVENDQLAATLSREALRHVSTTYSISSIAEQHIANYKRLISTNGQLKI